MYRRTCCEHAPVCGERLTGDVEHHIGALLGQQETAEMLVQVRWGHGYPSGRSSGFRRLLHAEFVGDDDHIQGRP